MSRLTRRTHKGITVNGCKTVFGQYERNGAQLTSAIVRLAAFEDILYAPDGTELITLDRLHELVEADRDDRIIIRPNCEGCMHGEYGWRNAKCVNCYGQTRYGAEKANYFEADAALAGKEARWE